MLLPHQSEEVREMVGDGKSKELLRAIIRKAAPVAGPRRRYGTTPRWHVVHCLAGHGSGYSRAICILLDLDPDEQVVMPRGCR